MRSDASLPGSACQLSQDSLFKAINDAVLSLPHACKLAQLQVSSGRSLAVVSSGNILPFRHNRLTAEERQKLLDALAD